MINQQLRPPRYAGDVLVALFGVGPLVAALRLAPRALHRKRWHGDESASRCLS
jgi:hypothetical protein